MISITCMDVVLFHRLSNCSSRYSVEIRFSLYVIYIKGWRIKATEKTIQWLKLLRSYNFACFSLDKIKGDKAQSPAVPAVFKIISQNKQIPGRYDPVISCKLFNG